MKKVGLLISEMNNGGAERVVSRLTHILSKDYLVYLIVFEDTYMQYDYDGTLVNLNVKSQPGFLNKIILLFKRIRALKKVKSQYGLNIVISFLDSPNFVNILSKTKECKAGISIRNYTANENVGSTFSKTVNYFIKKLYKKADVVVPVTKVIANNYIEKYEINKDKIQVIYNPYNIIQIEQLAEEELEEKYKKFMTEGKTFISVGRHMRQKGFWHLIKSFKIVHEKFDDAKLIIVGKDYSNGKVQNLINAYGLNDHVCLVGQQNNPFKFIRNSDVYVLSSLFEGFPNSMVEAMACRCPVIASDCKSGPREILYENPSLNIICKDIEKADFGILIPPMEQQEDWSITAITESERKLAEAMLLMLQNNKLREHYSIKALERAKCFSYERCRVSFTDIINNY